MTKFWIFILCATCSMLTLAMYPVIYKSKAYNFNDPGIDAFEITLDENNVLYIWREIDGVAIEVANLEHFCEPLEALGE